jgi:hypothetical protein
MDVIVHAELGGRPNIAAAFEQMLRYARQYQDEVWIPLRREVAAGRRIAHHRDLP